MTRSISTIEIATNKSYYGLGDTQFTHILFPQISQAVPRSSFSNVEDSQIYPFYYQESIFGSEIRSDLFNSATGNTLGMKFVVEAEPLFE